MSNTKYPIDINSKAWDDGYRDFMGGRHYYISRREEFPRFKNYNAGHNKAKEDVETLGREEAYTSWRLRKMQMAIGKPEDEARDILRLADGNVFRHEIDAVMIKLFSSSNAFNEGRDAVLNGRKDTDCPYSIMIDYVNYINWNSGFQSTELAVRLHGRQKVIETL